MLNKYKYGPIQIISENTTFGTSFFLQLCKICLGVFTRRVCDISILLHLKKLSQNNTTQSTYQRATNTYYWKLVSNVIQHNYNYQKDGIGKSLLFFYLECHIKRKSGPKVYDIVQLLQFNKDF